MPPTIDEIASRHERLREAMAANDLDAVLVGEKYNYWYLTGHRTREIEKIMRPMLFLLPRDGDPAAVVYRQQGSKVRATVPSVGLFDYEDLPFDVGLIEQALLERGLAEARVGFELGDNQRLGLPYNDLARVRATFPGMTISDAGPVLESQRLHKSPYEIATLTAVAEMSLRAWDRVIAEFRAGGTEREFATAMAIELCREGTDFDVAGHVTTATSRSSRDESLQAGDTVWCDFGATLDGYQADVGRRAVIGEPTDEHRSVQTTIATLHARSLEAVKPGARASDVARACSDAMVEAGLPALSGRKRIGHGLGLNAGEGPSLGLLDDTVLEPGMVICVEPRFFLPTGEKVHIEDVVVVTESGYDPISSGCADLAVIPV
jgi:Xaa-Pro aminopeptidase